MRAAVTVSSLLLAAGWVAAEPLEDLVKRNPAMTFVSCYDTSQGLGSQTSYTYQSSGWCQNYCIGKNAAVFAMTGGSDCLCGDELPPTTGKVALDKCNTKCNGWPADKCGGAGTYSVYLTGLQANVPSISSSTSTTTTSSGDSSTTTQDNTQNKGSPTTNSGGQTVYVTASGQSNQGSSSQPATTQKSSGGTNTAAIAAGVVVGVVGFAAIAGAAFFYYRSRQRRSESAYAADVTGYNNSPPMSESRYDGEYMAQRRQSNGSIDDDHDFSRRILQVTNPDRF